MVYSITDRSSFDQVQSLYDWTSRIRDSEILPMVRSFLPSIAFSHEGIMDRNVYIKGIGLHVCIQFNHKYHYAAQKW